VQSRLTLPGQLGVLLGSLGARARVVTIIAAATLAVGAAPADAESLVDDTVADFAAASASTWVTEPGSVRLRPMVLSEGFDDPGPTLPATLTSEQWSPPGGTAIVGSGSLTIDGTRVHPPDTAQTAPEVLELRATFANTPFQHVGLGITFNEPPWAMFSTGGGALDTGLYARTRDADGNGTDQQLVAIEPLEPHTYRIEWSPTEVRYFVDGTPVATHTVAIAGTLRPVASDFTDGSGTLEIDWLGVGSNPASGVFESRVHDASDARAVWENLTATSTGGTVEIETRVGNTSSPDMTWSSWQALGAGGAVASPIRRYIQYRASLSGGSPSLDRVEIGYEVDDVAAAAVIDDVDVNGAVATVRFSSPATDVDRLECRLGDAPGAVFSTCTSPKQFAGLGTGSYTVFVRAVDDAGNVGSVVQEGFTIEAPPASGGGQGAGTTPPSVPDVEPDETAPAIDVLTRSARASGSGLVVLRVSCPDDEVRCRLSVRLRHGRSSSQRKTASVLGGKQVRVRLRLPKATRMLLVERGRLRVTALVTARDEAGNVETTKHKFTLRPPSA
jgi:Glycosyl hydrolases family 16